MRYEPLEYDARFHDLDAHLANTSRILGDIRYYYTRAGKPWIEGKMVKFRKFNLFRFTCAKCGQKPSRYWTVYSEFYGPGGIHVLVHRYCMLCCFTRHEAEKMEANPVCGHSEKHGQMRPESPNRSLNS